MTLLCCATSSQAAADGYHHRPDRSASEVPSTGIGKFRITRGGCTDSDLPVSYTICGTATNRMDYRGIPTVATIRFRTRSVAIPVWRIDDTISEPDETVILTLSPNENYIIGLPNTATVRIHSNECTLAKFRFRQMRR